jgi:uncharacterized protein YxjI
MKNLLTILLIVLVLSSCKKEVETPKVSYENNQKSKVTQTTEDTTTVEVADLPIQFAGTNVLIYPVGKLQANSKRSKLASFDADDSAINNFKVSNNNDNEIAGFLSNLKFQTIGKDSISALSNKKLFIQTVTYLKNFAAKSKLQLLVYTLEDEDTNQDGTIDDDDINTLYISDIYGKNFIKISKNLEELIDWNIIEATNKLYFRTIEDTNKNGKFDKNDIIHYNVLDLLAKNFEAKNYNPL